MYASPVEGRVNRAIGEQRIALLALISLSCRMGAFSKVGIYYSGNNWLAYTCSAISTIFNWLAQGHTREELEALVHVRQTGMRDVQDGLENMLK